MSDARRANKYALYEASVQAPEHDVGFFERVYSASLGGSPKLLREDFCGTALICLNWVQQAADRMAYGVDLEPKVLRQARRRHLNKQPKDVQARVELIEADVRDSGCPPVDVIAAQNFSYCVFKTRDELREYAQAALDGLTDRGVFIMDLFGGYESIEDGREDVRELDGFDYVWEQRSYDPINAFGRYLIHFRFPDGSEKRDAFVYDWRLWTIPEVRELLTEVGFDRVDVYWEDEDPKTGEGTGYYRPQQRGTSDPAWNAYIVGIKGTS